MFGASNRVEPERPYLRMKRSALYRDSPKDTVVQRAPSIRCAWRVQAPAIHKHAQARPHARHSRQHGWRIIERILNVGTDECQDDGGKRFKLKAIGRTDTGAQDIPRWRAQRIGKCTSLTC